MSFSNPMQFYIFYKGVSFCRFLAKSNVFLTRLHCQEKRENFTSGATLVNKTHTQFTCVTRSLPVKTVNFNCIYAASTSRKIHATARHKATKLQVTSRSGCKLNYMKFPGEITSGVIAVLLTIAANFANNYGCFARKLSIFLLQ